MSGTKRPFTGEEQPQRKSRRTAAPPQRLGLAQGHGERTKQSVAEHALLDESKHFRKDYRLLNQSLQQHNKLIAFLDEDFRPSKSFINSQQRVSDAIAQVDQLMRDAELQIEKIQARVHERCTEIVQSIHCDVIPVACRNPYWWEAGNIFTLDYSQIMTAAHLQVPDDAARFVGYLYPLMNEYLGRQAAKHVEASTDFMDKVNLLRNLLLRSKDPAAEYQCFSFSLYLLLHAMPRCNFESWSPGMMKESRSWQSYLSASLSDYSTIGRRRVKKSGQKFLGAAGGFRELLRSYRSYECYFDSGIDRPECFHRRHISLLDDFLQRAHREVRENVTLAVCGTLPVELSDIVIEFTLAAEGLPTHNTVLKDRIDWDVDTSRPKRASFLAMLHDCYTCGHMLFYPRDS